MEVKEESKKHPFVTAYWYRRYRRDERIFPVYSIGINRYVFPRDQGQRKNRRPRSNPTNYICTGVVRRVARPHKSNDMGLANQPIGMAVNV